MGAGISAKPVPRSRWVDGGPFTSFDETFYIESAYWYGVLTVEVLTGYETYGNSASVKVNGQEVGKIEPRPLSQYNNLIPQHLIFPLGALGLGHPYPYTGLHRLRIDPVSPADWLVVGQWFLVHYGD
jgi:hypothetical protein